MRISISTILVALFPVIAFTSGRPQNGGSKCPNVSCSPPIPGAQCTARYERDDGCCPVWYCTQNGSTSTIYGKSTGGSSSSYSSSSSSFSSNGGQPGNNGNMPSFGGFSFQLPNFGNLFG